MTRSSVLRPMLVPGLPRVWRGPHTLQLGLDPSRAVLIDLPDPRAADVLDLLDGTRSERVVLTWAVGHGIAADDAWALLDTLHAAGFVVPAHTLLPSSLPDDARRRLIGEAAALALRRLTGPGPADVHPPTRTAEPAENRPPTDPTRSDPTTRRPTAPAPARPTTSEPIPSGPASARPTTGARVASGPAKARPTTSGRIASGPITAGPITAGPITAGPITAGPGGQSPAATLRRRRQARVVVTGAGRLGAGIAVALAEAGVGHVHPDLTGPVTPADLAGGPLSDAQIGSSRVEAVTAALHRAAPGVDTRPVRRGAASLVVQLGSEQPVAVLAAGYWTRRQPHLAVAVREGAAVVGPFVPATGAPCLQCLELHRQDRDAGRPAPLPPAGVEPCPVATLLAATGYAACEALTFLDGGSPDTVGAAVEITTPGRFRRRTWPPHPRCGCGRRGRSRARSAVTAHHRGG